MYEINYVSLEVSILLIKVSLASNPGSVFCVQNNDLIYVYIAEWLQ